MPNNTPYTNKTMQICDKMNTILYICGMTDFWSKDVKLPAGFMRVYKIVTVFIELLMISFLASEIAAFVTQKHLAPNQLYNLMLLTASHIATYSYKLILLWYRRRVRDVLWRLAFTLKLVHSNERLDALMLQKFKYYIVFFMLTCGPSTLLYIANAVWQCIESRPVTTAITAWPDVEDDSGIAQIGRVVALITWTMYFYIMSGSVHLVITVLVILRFQYMNLADYFEMIESTFHKSGEHSELEREYEAALRVGIKMHQDTLWCLQECSEIFGLVFSAQAVVSLWDVWVVLCEFMTLQRTLVNVARCLIMACAVIIMAGFMFCSAGDVTNEATNLSTAMYGSGWQHCSGASAKRVRKLLAPAMLQAQKPVLFLALGCVTMSYDTFLGICKSSYSVFSVMY